jgi:drug/metabolite transporter (DMT)-like permease
VLLRFPALPLYVSSLLFAVMALAGKALSPPHPASLSLAWVVLLRSLIALVVLSPAVLLDARAGLASLLLHGRGMVLRGVAGALSMWTYFLAIQCIPVGEAVLFSNTSPLWTALIASVFLKETMPPRLWLAFPATFCGVCLVSWPSLELGAQPHQLLGIVAGLASAAFAGAAYSTVRSLRGVPASWVASALLIAGTLSSAPLAALHAPRAMGASTWLLALLMGVSGGLAQWTMTIGYQYNKATRASTLNMTTVAFTVLLAWPALGESPMPIQLLGLALIFFGCANATSGHSE